MRKIDLALEESLSGVIASMGYEMVGYELTQQGRQSLLRIFIDRPTGVLIEDCTKVSRQISAMLDVESPFASQYILEVSSPGIDRPLFKPGQYQKFIGSRIKIRLHSPINQRRQYTGILRSVEEDNITLAVDDIEVIIPFAAIEKANIIAEIRL